MVARGCAMRTPAKSLLTVGITVGIGLAIHNFPEGLAIGSGFGASIKLGYSLAIAILLHDIPEGISMSVPLKFGGMGAKKVVLYTFLSGATTGLGAFVGAGLCARPIFGFASKEMIGICLALAARSNAVYCISENSYRNPGIYIKGECR